MQHDFADHRHQSRDRFQLNYQLSHSERYFLYLTAPVCGLFIGMTIYLLAFGC